MPFKLIAGTFTVIGTSPDGDTIHFKPRTPVLVEQLGGPPDHNNKRLKNGRCKLRIEAMDTLETHYKTVRQPDLLARVAGAYLVDFVGITNVVWSPDHATIVSASEETTGYILAKAVEKNQRVVAFVFRGAAPEGDGADVELTPERLRDSFNFAALSQGHAYPTYYEALNDELREVLTEAVAGARSAGKGVWPTDKTQSGVRADLRTITEVDPILPKLFRRLSDYLVKMGTAVGFKAAMELEPDEVRDLRTGENTQLHKLVLERQEGDAIFISLARQPEEMVFSEMQQKPTNAFSAMLEAAPVLPLAVHISPVTLDPEAEPLEPAV